MVDVAHGINSMLICLQEATSKIKRSMSSSLMYLQSKEAVEQNSTSEREPLLEKPDEDEKKRLACLDRRNTNLVSEKPEEDAMQRVSCLNRRVTNLVWELPKFGLLMATLVAGVSYSSGVSPLSGLWSDNDGEQVAEGSVLTDTYLRSYRAVYHFIVRSLQWWLCTLGIFYIMFLIRAILRFCTLAISALFARDCGNKVASETLEGVGERLLMVPAMATQMIYQTFISTPGTSFFSYIQDDHLPVGHRHCRRLVMPFLCFSNTVSRVGLTLLRRRTLMCHGQGFCSWAFPVCTGVAVVGLTTSICFSVLVVAVLLCIGLHILAFLLEPVKIWVRNIQETLQKCFKLSDPCGADDADQHLQKSYTYLLLISTLVATITYEADVKPPDGLWETNATDGLRGDQILHTTYPQMYQANFFYCNAIAFVASLAIVILLFRNICRTCGIKNCPLQVAMILDHLGLIREHATGSCRALWVCTAMIGLTGVFTVWSRRSLTTSICFSAPLVSALFCIGLLAFLGKPVDKRVPQNEETLHKCWKQGDTAESEDHCELVLHDADQHLQKPRKYLLLLATLVATITYQAGLKPPGGLRETNHYLAGDPILHTTYPRMYQASFYCNATAFVASLAIVTLLLRNICRTRGIKGCALQVAMIVNLLGLRRAHATGSCSESADPAVAEEDSNSPIKRTPLEATWRVACAAPHHMTGNKSLMLTGSYMPVHDGEVIMVHPGTNGEAVSLQVRACGSVRTESITLDDVWYVPGLDSNLVSTGQLARQGCAVNLGPGGCRITSGGALVGAARFTEACQFELDYLKVT